MIKKNFKEKADKIFKPNSLSDFITEEPKQEKKQEKELLKIEEKAEENKKKIRHEFRLGEELSEQIRTFLFEKRINKTKFFKSILINFFNKSAKEQDRILTTYFKKN